ncbi:MAG: hypothetical protein ISS45_03120 [Candidatus Omnitrophica bacterium]|nr:hypothetical protein [Candidatus Omnitrophota bacterium]
MEYPKDYFENIKKNMENKYREHLELNKRLFDLVTSAIERINAKGLRDTELDLFSVIVISMLAKTRKHYNSIQELCKLGFGEEAGIIVRSMTSTFIDLAYISKCGKKALAKRWVRFDWIIKGQKTEIAEMMDKLCKVPSLKGEELKKWEKRKKEIHAQIDKFRKDYKSEQTKYDWSGYSIKTKAEKTGKGTKLLYHTVYRYNSDIEHSNATALDKYIDDDTPKKIQFLSEPSESHVEENLRESFNVFLRIAVIFFEQFGLEDFKKKAGELTKDFLKLYNKNINKHG